MENGKPTDYYIIDLRGNIVYGPNECKDTVEAEYERLFHAGRTDIDFVYKNRPEELG